MIQAPLFGQVIGSMTGDFVIAEWTQEATDGNSEPMLVAPWHRHLDCDEAWYVLEGTLCVQVDDVVFTAHAGDCVVALKGTKHSFWNPAQVPARYLLVMTPLTAKLIEAIHAALEHSTEAMQRIFAQHGAEYLGW